MDEVNGSLVDAASPGRFAAEVLRSTPAATTGRWWGIGDLTGEEHVALSGLFERLRADELPAQAAATYLAGWVAGAVATDVALTVALTGAGIAIDIGTARWHEDDDGWIDSFTFDAARWIVPKGHPWVGLEAVEVVATWDECVAATMSALVADCEPIVAACRRLARVGVAGLWNEIADAFGSALTHRDDLAVDDAANARLGAALAATTGPWRSTPEVWVADLPSGPAYVAHRGGCCLAYTSPHRRRPPDEAHMDDTGRAFHTRFPSTPGVGRYCSTCSLLDRDEAEARQLFWTELSRGNPSPT